MNFFYSIILITCFTFASSCASLKEANKKHLTRTYIGSLEKVAEDASLAFAHSGINIEHISQKEEAKEVEIMGYIQVPAASVRNFVGDRGGVINFAQITMTLKTVSGQMVFTHINASTSRSHAMASSAEDNHIAGNPVEDIYSFLDKKYSQKKPASN